MAKSGTRPAEGLEPEKALERYSDPDEWAAMSEYEDAREYISVSAEFRPHPKEERHKEYRRRREPLEAALIEKLVSGELVGTTLGESSDPSSGRDVIHKSRWRHLDIDYDFDDASGGGSVFPNLEIAEVGAIPLNVTYIPDWVLEQTAPDEGCNDMPTGVVQDAGYQHLVIGGRNISFGPYQAKVVAALDEASDTPNPWRSGKELLQAAGSDSRNIGELFRSKSGWRDLIESDGRGYYRLKISLRPGWKA